MTDGSSVTGDIVKSDDNGVMIHTPSDVYTNLAWGQFSQDSLKELSQNPKIAPLVAPFIEPTEPAHAEQRAITIKPVSRLERPAHPSVFLGLIKSPVGLFILLVLYAANLLAAYEISIVKARTPGQVMGVAAILPVIGPVIFLWLPMYVKPVEEEMPAEMVTAPSGTGDKPAEEIAVVETAWRKEEKVIEPQIFQRGKFTFNKRFVETKFAGYFGEPKGDALKFTMEVKTSKDSVGVERIMQVSATDVIFETSRGQVTVMLADIQEVKLNPKPA